MAFNAVPPEEDLEKMARLFSHTSDRNLKVFFSGPDYAFEHSVFPLIDTSCMRVLYADDRRPSYPTNILTAFELYKLMNGLTDADLLRRCATDPAVQAALHLYQLDDDWDDSDEDEAVHCMCRHTLERFRERCRSYYDATGTDLMREVLMDMAVKAMLLLGTDQTMRRIDSGFVDSHIESLTRFKLMYRVTAGFVRDADRLLDFPPVSWMEHYLGDNDWNSISYHDQRTPFELKLSRVLNDARYLLTHFQGYGDLNQLESWEILERVYSEQVFEEADGTLRLKKSRAEGLNSTTVQSPADPDATFRKKAGEEHHGYTGLIVDYGQSPTTIHAYWKYAANITSDQTFLDEYLENEKKIRSESDAPVLLVGDGLFSAESSRKTGAEMGIRIVTTNLAGKKPDLFLLKHRYSEDLTTLLQCAGGKEPISSAFNEKNRTITAHFSIETCENCPLSNQCRAYKQKKSYALKVDKGAVERARYQENLSEEEFNRIARYRNGVESNFSLLRRFYTIDKMPVRGFMDTSYWFDCVMGAMNAKQICHYFEHINKQILKTL